MAFNSAKESDRIVRVEYTPPTPPLTPQKHKQLTSSLNVKYPVVCASKGQLEECKMRRTYRADKSSSSSSSSSSSAAAAAASDCPSRRSADSIIPKIFTAAPPTTLVPPLHTLRTHNSDNMFQEDEYDDDDEEEEERETFKLQDPPKRKAKAFSESHDRRDEFDCSPQKSTQEVTSVSPSRDKGQMSITQFMIPASPQHGTRLRSKSSQSPLPHSPYYTKLVQSPCTPSKCAKSNDGGNFFFSDLPTGESNTFVFPSVSYSKTPLTPSTPPFFSHYKTNRKRSVDMSSVNDKEILDDFTDLNMASTSPLAVDSLSVRGRCRLAQDESDYYIMSKKSSTVTPPSPRLVKSLCERRQKPAEASVYKDCFVRTPCRYHEENTSGGYSNRSYCKQANILEDDSMLCPTERNVCLGHKSSQESCQQKMRFEQRPCSTKAFRHSLSGLVPLDHIHDPEHPLPDDFPYESTFVPSYDNKGIYRKDEMYNRIQALKDDSDAGKIMCRRWSNKDSIRTPSCDNLLWDSDLLPSSPPSHNEATHSATILLPPPSPSSSSSSPSPFTLHHTTLKGPHLTSRHASPYSHPAISPVSKISPVHAQSFRSTPSTGDRCSQTSEVRYEEVTGSSSSSSCQREYLSALQSAPSLQTLATPLESSSLICRQQSQLITSTSNPFTFPTQQQQQQQQKKQQQQYDVTHSTPIKSPAPPLPAPSSHSPAASFRQSPCHINCQRRGTSSPYGGWPPSGELPCHQQSRVYDYTDRQRNGVAKRRLFCRQSEETEQSSTDGEANLCCHHFPDDHRLHYPESPSSSSSSSSGQHRRSHYDSIDTHFSFSGGGRSTSSQHQVPPVTPCNCCTGRCSSMTTHHPNSHCCLQRYHTAPAAYSQEDTYNI